jgi:hypothetical protein
MLILRSSTAIRKWRVRTRTSVLELFGGIRQDQEVNRSRLCERSAPSVITTTE